MEHRPGPQVRTDRCRSRSFYDSDKNLLLVSRTNVSSLHEDHESRLRVMELREEEQRKQVQVVVRQYTGQFHN